MKKWMAGLTVQAHPDNGAGNGDNNQQQNQGGDGNKGGAGNEGGDGNEKPGAGGDGANKDGKGGGSKDGAEGKGGGDGKGDEGAPKPKAPEKYALKIEGDAKTYVTDADVKYLEDVARKADWTNEEAQAALDEHVQTMAAASARYAEETKADKTYGGDNFDQTRTLANAAIDAIRPAGHPRRESFNAFLARGGAGNHIEVVSFLADLGKLLGEDRPAKGGGGPKQEKSMADKLYGSKETK